MTTSAGSGPPIVAVDLTDLDLVESTARVPGIVFQHPTRRPAAETAARWAGRRVFAAVEDGRAVASFGDFDADLAVPAVTGAGGLPTVPTFMVTMVGVLPTHRRRGLLTRYMTGALERAKEQGAVIASLIASEAPIYGRFGFGPAIASAELTVDVRGAAGFPPAAGSPCGRPHRVRITDDDDLGAFGPALYEAARQSQVGAPPRPARGWDDLLGPASELPARARLVLAHESTPGAVDGYVRLGVAESWNGRVATSTAHVEDAAAVDGRVTACLWRECLALDLVATVVAADRPIGDPLAEMLVDRRGVRARYDDLYWWRVLDVPAALSSREWFAPCSLVIDVIDDSGWAAGRWRLDADGRADVSPTSAPADLTMRVDTLAGVVAGTAALHARYAAGLVDEHRAGALAALAAAQTAPAVSLVRYEWF